MYTHLTSVPHKSARLVDKPRHLLCVLIAMLRLARLGATELDFLASEHIFYPDTPQHQNALKVIELSPGHLLFHALNQPKPQACRVL